MPEEIKTPVKPVETKPQVLTLADAKAHLSKVEQNLKTYEGKDGVNPFIWAKQRNLPTLRDRLNKGDVSVISLIMAIPVDAKPVVEL